MASVYVVGEILGASGLSCPGDQEAFSVSHVADLLSLHPSSEFSYFCKWRLVVNDPAKLQHEEPSWKVVQGETQGQTQVHAASSGGSLAMPDLYRHGTTNQERRLLPKMDTVWAHPVDLHLALTSMSAWNCWPRLEFQVWSLDKYQREALRGTASVQLPMATSEYVLDVPLVQQESRSVIGSLARAC
ncbi:B9 domain-containing protein 2 [Phytophthora cinnamomi]|uniref:B9 domain-containing protein 2 n=1 Tax=Phytophthora cinnamomi TaxID=4785 RepID=UPI003559ABDA|nr:B9 domain-containing protein 2 [Phytophthora cinnamomi]